MKQFLIYLLILILCILILYPREKNIIYIPNFLSSKDFTLVKDCLKKNKNGFKNESFRKVRPLFNNNNYNTNHYNKNIYDIFYSPKYISKINNHCEKTLYKSTFPIEHRIYPTGSKGMKWHRDTLMYNLPQYEAVFTINNTSDSLTEWIDNGYKKSQFTEPNSLLLVKAVGDYHSVTPVNRGNREILKLIYTQSNNPNINFYKELERFRIKN